MEEGEIGEERKSRRSRHENYDESSNPGPGQAYPPPVSGHPSGMNDYFSYKFIKFYVEYYFIMKHA